MKENSDDKVFEASQDGEYEQQVRELQSKIKSFLKQRSQY